MSKKAFRQKRTFNRAKQLAYGTITCLGRHTITGIISSCGRQFKDWSYAYRVFGNKRIDIEKLFDVARESILEELKPEQMIVAHMDDTIFKKTGKKVAGTAWRRDPLGPPFHTNFIWGQRFLQISMALPNGEENCQAKAIPIDLHHCPTIKKLPKDADVQQRKIFNEQQRIAKLSKQGSLRIRALRSKLDMCGSKERELVISVDGSYTNATVLKSLPQRVTLIGRIRKDAKFYGLPGEQSVVGRKKVYGDRIPTPEQIRQSNDIPWGNVKAWSAGKSHDFNIKVIKDLRWRAAGKNYNLKLLIIRPLSYRLTKSSRLLYRQPAYLICTDNNLSSQKILQAYLWRWEIEVNFRDEKTILGCGEAQVRNSESVKNIPAFVTALYAFIHLAIHRSCKNRNNSILPRPKWYPTNSEQRITTSEIINLFRAHLWVKPSNNNFSGFLKKEHLNKSLRNQTNPLTAAVLYARK